MGVHASLPLHASTRRCFEYSESYLTDGTSAGTFFAFKAWRLPVVSADRVIFSDSPLSSTLSLYSTSTGYVQGRVTSQMAPSGPNAEGLVGVSLFLDRNDDGVRQDDEMLTKSSEFGRYLFEGVPAGAHTVRVADAPTRFAETHEVPTVQTKRNSTRTADLVVADRRKIYGVTGHVSGRNARSGEYASAMGGMVYIDRNRNGARDAGEAYSEIDEDGYFVVDGLRAGSYQLGLELPEGGGFAIDPGLELQRVVVSQQRVDS